MGYHSGMRLEKHLHPDLIKDCKSKGIDLKHSLAVLDLVNEKAKAEEATAKAQTGQTSSPKPPSIDLPQPQDPRLIDASAEGRFPIGIERAKKAFEEYELPAQILEKLHIDGNTYVFDRESLIEIGRRLYTKTAFGVLNGGSATSYADTKKNRDIDGATFAKLQKDFERLAARLKGQPKGITPAYFKEDGSDGASFLELKFRSLLQEVKEAQKLGLPAPEMLPTFQMSSLGTRQALAAAYKTWQDSPYLKDLIEQTGNNPLQVLDATQPLLAALSPKDERGRRTIFSQAWGQENSALALPGGHGENFRVLKPVYRELKDRGIRFAWLGNVDNTGYTVDPISLACLALSGNCAAFEFSSKSALDVKGGVLIIDGQGLSVRDIGQSISWEEIGEAESRGGLAVFNCATGLFDLNWLVPRLDEISRALPIRVSEQNKESGVYAQAEQTTWEVLGLMENPLILRVERAKRFLPAKMLLETLIASPATSALLEDPAIPDFIRQDGQQLRLAMQDLLKERYQL